MQEWKSLNGLPTHLVQIINKKSFLLKKKIEFFFVPTSIFSMNDIKTIIYDFLPPDERYYLKGECKRIV